MQVVKAYNKEIISEVAAMCGDSEYRDHKREFYGQSVFRAMRQIAQAYHLIEYAIYLNVEEFEVDAWLQIPVTNFKGEIEVRVNDLPYNKVNDDPKNQYEYVIKFTNDAWVLDYYGKATDDTIYIKYASDGQTADEFDGTPLVPNRYYEELLSKAVVYISKVGAAKFTAERREKYLTLFKIYDTPYDDYDPHLARDNQWITVKPFDPFRRTDPDESEIQPNPIITPPDRGLYA